MTLFDGLVAAGVIGGIVFIVMAKAAKENPKLREWLSNLKPGNLTEKIVPEKIIPDKIEQVYDEKRRMM